MNVRLNVPEIADLYGVPLAMAERAFLGCPRWRCKVWKSDVDQWFVELAATRRERRKRLHDKATTVYIVKCDDTIIYVGITGSNVGRLSSHRHADVWWSDASSITLEHFADRASAEQRERDLIKRYAPRHNVVHRPANGLAVMPRC